LKNLEEKAQKIYEALFEGKEEVEFEGETYPIETYSPSGVRHVNVDNFQFLEQNPKKDSHWAKKARQGQKILWIMKDWDYIGQIHEGKFKDFREKEKNSD